MGYSRQQFYEIRRNFQTYGTQGLIDRLPGAKGPHPNRVDEQTEQAILDYSLQYPTHGPVRVAHQMIFKAFKSVLVEFAGYGAAIVYSAAMNVFYVWRTASGIRLLN